MASSSLRTARRTILSSLNRLPSRNHRRILLLHPLNAAVSSSLFHFRPFAIASTSNSKSPFEANILRILRNEIDYQSEYAPPHEPLKKFEYFTVQDRPGETWMTMRGRFSDDGADIKLEATMFDGYESVPKTGDDSSGEAFYLHISLLVDISKGDGSEALEFVCSAWPDRLEIQKVYLLNRDKMLDRPYFGPDFKNLSHDLQQALRKFLGARGVNNELSVFLHNYMMNKDRIELIKWLGKVKEFVDR